ncbi:TPA: hypothetical protein NBJ98_004435 [Citrobacter freundii]|nr:hypothetical protein [Citrobacter freundii]
MKNNKIKVISEKLISSYWESNSIHKGNLGEMIAIHHFEITNQAFIHVNQDVWSYPPAMEVLGAKRPDFFMLDKFKIIKIIDVKMHTLDENLNFILHNNEMVQYANLHKHLMSVLKCEYEDINFEFFVIHLNSQEATFAAVSFQEMLDSENKVTLTSGRGEINSYNYSVSIKERLKPLFK